MTDLILYNFFKDTIKESTTFQGRFAVLEGYGNDLNSDNLDDNVIGSTIASNKWTKKYPCVLMMPPREVSNNLRLNTTRYFIEMYFCTTSFIDALGFTKAPNKQVNYSSTPILQDQAEMAERAREFYEVMLDRIYDSLSVRQSIRSARNEGFEISRFSLKNNDKVSGAKLTFQISVVNGCSIDDYINNQTTLADYACFNSDLFLESLINQGGRYGYQAMSINVNGTITPNSPLVMFNAIDRRVVPVQEGDRITIPAYDVEPLSYDYNWIQFLQDSVPGLIFRTSPFTNLGTFHDEGYPVEQINGDLIDPSVEGGVYGEGFQIEWSRGWTFSFAVDFWYHIPGQPSPKKSHRIVYTETEMIIDGANVPNANQKDVDEYVF